MLEAKGIIIKKGLLILLGVIIWVIFFILPKLIKYKGKILQKYILRDCFFKFILIIYFSLLIGVTLFPIRLPSIDFADINPVINLNLFSILNYGFNIYSVINIVGNLLLLAPLPIILNLNNFNKLINLKNVVISSFFISLSIELLQYLEAFFKIVYIPRATDILDLLLNTLGGLLGYFILRIYEHYQKSIKIR